MGYWFLSVYPVIGIWSLVIYNILYQLVQTILLLNVYHYFPKGKFDKDFLKEWLDKRSVVREAYDSGKLLADFQVINKQRELAESGNITAAQIFLKETKEREIANIRDKILKDDAN